ncbi:hypothetical protein K505DRAFT_338143 [Melanomma pulvis-pyrius CBS 109.77]|uniref:Uncharacterized protein n=1 Tax=Melanomma pulvis-pyrius CBS 109.77 TaxID=1314802 RepID=A0A6A6X9V2_9PLEO|nr:hypothetical protein K505DRAFT_338143 [Melanomma pulvis-pyrius CBS 109.77]
MYPRHDQDHSRHEQKNQGHDRPVSTSGYANISTANHNHNGTRHSSPYYQTPPNGSAHASSSSSQHHPYQQQPPPQSWHSVSRPWDTMNPEVHQAMQAPALNPTPHQQHHHQYPHGHTPTGQPYQPANRNPQYQGSPSSAPQHRLTSSSLQQVDTGRAPPSRVALWMNEDQRVGGWNGVGSSYKIIFGGNGACAVALEDSVLIIGLLH